MTFSDLNDKIINWAGDKDLIHEKNSPMQAMKIMEEVGEMFRAYIKKDRDGLIDGIGDAIVTLIIFATQNDLDVTQCLEAAWNEIKDRTGKTVNGSLLKS